MLSGLKGCIDLTHMANLVQLNASIHSDLKSHFVTPLNVSLSTLVIFDSPLFYQIPDNFHYSPTDNIGTPLGTVHFNGNAILLTFLVVIYSIWHYYNANPAELFLFLRSWIYLAETIQSVD